MCVSGVVRVWDASPGRCVAVCPTPCGGASVLAACASASAGDVHLAVCNTSAVFLLHLSRQGALSVTRAVPLPPAAVPLLSLSLSRPEADVPDVGVTAVEAGGGVWRWRGAHEAPCDSPPPRTPGSDDPPPEPGLLLGWAPGPRGGAQTRFERASRGTASSPAPPAPARARACHTAASLSPGDGAAAAVASPAGWAVVATGGSGVAASASSARRPPHATGDGPCDGVCFVGPSSLCVWDTRCAQLTAVSIPPPPDAGQPPPPPAPPSRAAAQRVLLRCAVETGGGGRVVACGTEWASQQPNAPPSRALFVASGDVLSLFLLPPSPPQVAPREASRAAASACLPPHPTPPDDAVTCSVFVTPSASCAAPAWLVLGTAGGCLRVLPLPPRREPPSSLPGHVGRVACLAAPSPCVVVSGGEDATLRVWDLHGAGVSPHPATCVAVLRCHVAPLSRLWPLGHARLGCEDTDGRLSLLRVAEGEGATAQLSHHAISILLLHPDPALVEPPDAAPSSIAAAAPPLLLTASLLPPPPPPLSLMCWAPTCSCVVATRSRGVSPSPAPPLLVWDGLRGSLERVVTDAASCSTLLGSCAASFAPLSSPPTPLCSPRAPAGWAPCLVVDAAGLVERGSRRDATAALGALHVWGLDAPADAAVASLCDQPRGCESPPVPTTPCVAGAGGAVTLPCCGDSARPHPSEISDFLTPPLLALRALAVCALARRAGRQKSVALSPMQQQHHLPPSPPSPAASSAPLSPRTLRGASARVVSAYAAGLRVGCLPAVCVLSSGCVCPSSPSLRAAATSLLVDAPQGVAPRLEGPSSTWVGVEAAGCGTALDAAGPTGRWGVIAAAAWAVAGRHLEWDGAAARTLSALRSLSREAPARCGTAALSLLASGCGPAWWPLLSAPQRSSLVEDCFAAAERLVTLPGGGVDAQAAREAASELLASVAAADLSLFCAVLGGRFVGAGADNTAHVSAFVAAIRAVAVASPPSAVAPHLEFCLEAACAAAGRRCAAGAAGLIAELLKAVPTRVAVHRPSARVAVAAELSHALFQPGAAPASPRVRVYDTGALKPDHAGLVRELAGADGEPPHALGFDAEGGRVAQHAGGALRFWVVGPGGGAPPGRAPPRPLPPARSTAAPAIPGLRLSWAHGVGAGVGLVDERGRPHAFLAVIAAQQQQHGATTAAGWRGAIDS